ncbi:hypothetical protein [Emticicia sp. CRIBPO]|uniref:hypothetical protein n=1 Tax=Emticicia sp. CRIBPO TaxID=2683258 RepID=UPI001E37AA1E|nr:hypothetical protein [Emticicia sp. CRIBPO]
MEARKTIDTGRNESSELRNKIESTGRIERGMSPEEVSEVISDRIVELVKRQLEEIQKRDNEK